MVVATPAPKPRYPALTWIAYVYAGLLTLSSVVVLMGVGGFDFAHIAYQTPGSPVMAVIVAALQIYAIPFVVQLHLSLLARFFSAMFTVAAPLFMLGYACYLQGEGLVTDGWLIILASAVLLLLGAVSFAVLDGRRALRFSKK